MLLPYIYIYFLLLALRFLHVYRITADAVQSFQTLDLHQTAQNHLYKQLAKTKRIAESPAFQQFKQGEKGRKIPTDIRRDAAEANVVARLFKSNPVKNVLPDFMRDTRKLLGIDDVPARQKETEERGKEHAPSRPGRERSSRSDTRPAVGEEDPSPEPESEEAAVEDVDMGDFDADSASVDFARFDARLASTDGESEDEKRGSAQDDDIEVSGSDDLALRAPQSPQQQQKPKKSTEAPKSTTFLPSLMMGGYWSGSESASEEEEQPRRKNRMGQQARRALWEKKYGARANHVLKEKQKQTKSKGSRGRDSRDSGWDLRKGATDPDDDDGGRGGGRGKWERKGPKFSHRPDKQRNHDTTTKQGKGSGAADSKGKDRALHPSWEAAKLAKEQATQVSFQGKKTTFD